MIKIYDEPIKNKSGKTLLMCRSCLVRDRHMGCQRIGTAVEEIYHMIEENGTLLSENPLPEEVLATIERLYGVTKNSSNA